MDVLLPVSHHLHDWSNTAGQWAAELARQGNGTLTGLYVFEPYLAMPETGMPMLISDAVVYMQEHLRAAAEAGAAFGAWAKSHGVDHTHWRVVQGTYQPTLARESAWCDLIVLRRSDGDPRSDVATVGAAVLNGELPALVVPDHAVGTELAHIAVAWNGRAEGTRAIQSALPLLERARRVTLLRGARHDIGEARAWTPARDAEQHLAAHGIRVEACEIEADDAHAGDAILEAVQSSGADLLVMGAFGRSRFSEWAIGGATRQVLAGARVPVLMRH